MTQDFRQSNLTQRPIKSAIPEDKSRQVVLVSLYSTSIAFFLAGMWLLLGKQGVFPSDISTILGLSLLAVALTDMVVIKVLKKVWRRK